jgi:magnesium-transporting ATPase (P-type)
MEANIGIGIYGEEGMSAAQASDFSIGEFQLLKRLLFFHGRINLFRISKMILYFFFKNFTFTMIQLYYSFTCLSSGQTFVDDWYITCYNLIFTAFPLCISALSDSDIDIKDEKEKKNLALLYKENRDKYRLFTFKVFLWKLIKGIIYSLIIFMFCFVNETLVNGRNKNMWYLSLKTYTCILIVVSMNLLINSNYIVYYLPLSIGITTFFLYGIFLIINHFGFFFYFNSKASIKLTFSSLLTYLHIILLCFFSFLFDYTNKLLIIYFSKSLSSRLILKRSAKSERKFSHDINKLMNSKSYKKSSRKKDLKRNSLNYEDKSKNLLFFKSCHNINNIKIKNNTPKAYNNSKYKIGPDYKNEFFSLRLVKLNDSEDKSIKKKVNHKKSIINN